MDTDKLIKKKNETVFKFEWTNEFSLKMNMLKRFFKFISYIKRNRLSDLYQINNMINFYLLKLIFIWPRSKAAHLVDQLYFIDSYLSKWHII